MITCQARNDQGGSRSGNQMGNHSDSQRGDQSGNQGRSGIRAGIPLTMTPVERALVRLLTAGYVLHDAAPVLGLSVGEARALLNELQGRAGVPSETRLIVLAVLNAWV